MGIAFVFALYIIAVALFAVPAALGCAWVAGRIARRCDQRTRRIFRLAGAAFPFLAGGYLLAFVVAMGLFGVATGRDMGFGDGFELRLPNSYHFSAIDTPESACVYRDKRDEFTACGSGPGSFYQVLALQQDGDWLAGAFDGTTDAHPFPDQQKADHWFLFNTRTGERVDANSEADLRTKAAARGVKLALVPAATFYSDHRFHAYDLLVALLLLAPGVLICLWLIKRAKMMLHREPGAARVIAPQPTI
jgi:hypothetical protein